MKYTPLIIAIIISIPLWMEIMRIYNTNKEIHLYLEDNTEMSINIRFNKHYNESDKQYILDEIKSSIHLEKSNVSLKKIKQNIDSIMNANNITNYKIENITIK